MKLLSESRNFSMARLAWTHCRRSPGIDRNVCFRARGKTASTTDLGRKAVAHSQLDFTAKGALVTAFKETTSHVETQQEGIATTSACR